MYVRIVTFRLDGLEAAAYRAHAERSPRPSGTGPG